MQQQMQQGCMGSVDRGGASAKHNMGSSSRSRSTSKQQSCMTWQPSCMGSAMLHEQTGQLHEYSSSLQQQPQLDATCTNSLCKLRIANFGILLVLFQCHSCIPLLLLLLQDAVGYIAGELQYHSAAASLHSNIQHSIHNSLHGAQRLCTEPHACSAVPPSVPRTPHRLFQHCKRQR
jgi:hypothetical protein